MLKFIGRRVLYTIPVILIASFVLFVSGVGKLHFSYIRYLENALRGTFDLAGVPIRFIIRGKREKNA